MSQDFKTEMIKQKYLDLVRAVSGRYWTLCDKFWDGSITDAERDEFSRLRGQYDEVTGEFLGYPCDTIR